jgi:hypothetical protein
VSSLYADLYPKYFPISYVCQSTFTTVYLLKYVANSFNLDNDKLRTMSLYQIKEIIMYERNDAYYYQRKFAFQG